MPGPAGVRAGVPVHVCARARAAAGELRLRERVTVFCVPLCFSSRTVRLQRFASPWDSDAARAGALQYVGYARDLVKHTLSFRLSWPGSVCRLRVRMHARDRACIRVTVHAFLIGTRV